MAEFSNNNSYLESIKMAPFEALYGRKCRTPLNWVELGKRRYYGIDFVKEAKEQVWIIQQHMEAAQPRQKSYADKRSPLVFEVGDYMYLKVSSMKRYNDLVSSESWCPSMWAHTKLLSNVD